MPKGDNFIYNLKKSITDYSVKTKLVEKISKCNSCNTDINSKTICQKACPFNAILKDSKIIIFILIIIYVPTVVFVFLVVMMDIILKK